MRTRKARLPDALKIHALVAEYAREEVLLPRSLGEICENIRDFTVVESADEVIGCGALHLYGLDLAEVRSIAVARHAQGRGAGRRLVKALRREAERHGVARVFLFTRIPDYFVRLGFAAVSHQSLPEKIWKDCLKCPRFACCDETAMIFNGRPAFARRREGIQAAKPEPAAAGTAAHAQPERRGPAAALLRILPG